MLTRQAPALARQSWKISLLNYFVAVLVGCCVGSLGLGASTAFSTAHNSSHALLNVIIGTSVFLIFSLPFAILGLLPLTLLGELLARKTSLHPLWIGSAMLVISVPLAIWVMPGARSASSDLTAASFGLLVAATWSLLSFRKDGFSAMAPATDHV